MTLDSVGFEVLILFVQALLWIPLLLACAFVSRAAFHLAHLKRRPEQARTWAALAFVMPFALPLLTLWKRKPAKPLPQPRNGVGLVVLMNLFVVAQAVGIMRDVAQYGNLTGYPECSSAAALAGIETSQKSFYSLPAPNERIVRLAEARERSATPVETTADARRSPGALAIRKCTAAATLSDSTERTVNYTIGPQSRMFMTALPSYVNHVDLKVFWPSRPHPWDVRVRLADREQTEAP